MKIFICQQLGVSGRAPATGRLLVGWLTGAALIGGCALPAAPGPPPPGQVAVRSGTDMTEARRRLDHPLRETDRQLASGDPWYHAWQEGPQNGTSTTSVTGDCAVDETWLTGAPPQPCPPAPPASADPTAADPTAANPTAADPTAAEIDPPTDLVLADLVLADRAGAPVESAADLAAGPGSEPDMPGAATADGARADIFLGDSAQPALPQSEGGITTLPPGAMLVQQADDAVAASTPAPEPASDPEASGRAEAIAKASALPHGPALPGSGNLPDDPAAAPPMADGGLPVVGRRDADDLLAGVPLPDLDLALAYPDGGAGEPADGDAAQLTLDVTARVVGIVDDPSLSPDARQDALHMLLTDRVNVRGLARFAAGRHWRAATQSVRHDYERLFSELMVLIYGNRLRKIARYDLKVVDAFLETLGRESVEMVARDEDGQAVEVNWQLRRLGGRLRIEDIELGGVSFRNTQRDELRVVFEDGGDLRGAVVLLRRKVAAFIY